MKRNVGIVDRVIRVVAGLALLSLLFIVEGVPGGGASSGCCR
jgi:hypothetical protein